MSTLSCLRVRIQRGLVLLQKLLLDCDVVISDAQNSQPILRFLRLLPFSLLGFNLGNQFILNENEGFHGMLQGQLVLAHLTQDGTDIEMDVSGVKDLKTLIDTLFTELKEIILNFQSLLQVVES
jgi:hypothetical protein